MRFNDLKGIRMRASLKRGSEQQLNFLMKNKERNLLFCVGPDKLECLFSLRSTFFPYEDVFLWNESGEKSLSDNGAITPTEYVERLSFLYKSKIGKSPVIFPFSLSRAKIVFLGARVGSSEFCLYFNPDLEISGLVRKVLSKCVKEGFCNSDLTIHGFATSSAILSVPNTHYRVVGPNNFELWLSEEDTFQRIGNLSEVLSYEIGNWLYILDTISSTYY